MTFAPPMRAAEGGEVYPRRNGGIMPNEGVHKPRQRQSLVNAG